MEKRLKVNTAILDMLTTKPEAVEAYDEIRVNCGMCLTTEKTRPLLSNSRFHMNTAQIVEVKAEEDTKVMIFNGGKKITAQFAAPADPTVCIINGALIIEDSPKKSLDQYKAVIINGAVLHPMGFDTSNFYVNGGSIPYPDGAILILQELDLTNAFINAAVPGATYFVQGTPSNFNNIGPGSINSMLKRTGLRALEPLDLDALKRKNIRFYTGWVTAIEKNAEQLLQITDGFMGSTIIPSGYKMMEGGRLDMLAVRRFGKRIFVEGDLQVFAEDADALAAVERLQVNGNVCVADCVADAFFEKCAIYGKVTVYKGEWMDISHTTSTIDKELLEDMDDGVTLNISHSTVEISTDVTAELASEKIHEIILNSSTLILGLDQQKALRRKIRNHDADVVIREYENTVEAEPEPKEQEFTETKVNSAYYKL